MSEDKQDLDMEQIDKDLKAALAGEDFGEPEQDDEDLGEGTPDYTDAEKKAMSMGWTPDRDALEEAGKEWIPAEEFLRNQTFFDEIKKLKREIRQQRKVTEAFKEQNKIAAEKAYEQAISDLKAQRKAAAADEDIVRVLEIDEQIDEVKESRNKNATANHPVSEYTPEDWEDYHDDFVANNPWYETDRVKRAVADREGIQYIQKNPGVSPEDAYNYVLQVIEETFPVEQKPEKKPKAASVAGGKRRVAAKPATTKHTLDDIPEEHRSIAMTLIKTGNVSEEDYLKQYFPEDYS